MPHIQISNYISQSLKLRRTCIIELFIIRVFQSRKKLFQARAIQPKLMIQRPEDNLSIIGGVWNAVRERTEKLRLNQGQETIFYCREQTPKGKANQLWGGSQGDTAMQKAIEFSWGNYSLKQMI